MLLLKQPYKCIPPVIVFYFFINFIEFNLIDTEHSCSINKQEQGILTSEVLSVAKLFSNAHCQSSSYAYCSMNLYDIRWCGTPLHSTCTGLQHPAHTEQLLQSCTSSETKDGEDAKCVMCLLSSLLQAVPSAAQKARHVHSQFHEEAVLATIKTRRPGHCPQIKFRCTPTHAHSYIVTLVTLNSYVSILPPFLPF